MENTFKCKDEVIYRSKLLENPIWTYGVFSHYEEKGGITYGVVSGNCGLDVRMWDFLPYEGNEHLVGKPICDEQVCDLKEGEWLFVFDVISDIPFRTVLRKFLSTTVDKIRVLNLDHILMGFSDFKYAVRFSDFNPENMVETKKKILYVKGNKIYRESIPV